MLDENLPAFFLRPSATGIKHHRDILLSHHGSDPVSVYSLQHIDPSSTLPAHKNCYAAALFDAYSPEVLFGETLARPGWVQPTLSQEEIRRQGGVPPPPQPVLPSEFVVQLYNPDQQIRIDVKEGKWGASDTYEFALPMSTFRTPSASNLDRGQSDPASLAVTPKVYFVWKRESKLSKDLTCFMTGKSTDTVQKKKSGKREADIAVGLWRSMRELTVYEPNLSRVEIEDPKGLEVVLLLSAVVLKDLYFANKEHMREIFNIPDLASERKLSGGGRRLTTGAQSPPTTNDVMRTSLPRLQTTPPGSAQVPAQSQFAPPVADPRKQWEIEAETARLKAAAEAEAREARRLHERKLKQKDKEDELERKRLLKMVEDEQRAEQRRRAEIDRETERLRREYGVQQIPPHPSPNLYPPQQANSSQQRPRYSTSQPPPPQRYSSQDVPFMSGANPAASGGSSSLGVPPKQASKKKSSFFGLRRMSDEHEDQSRLTKKGSAMW